MSHLHVHVTALTSELGIPRFPRLRYREAPLPLPQSLYGRRSLAHSYGDVITKFSRLDGFTKISKVWGSARAPSARGSSAIKNMIGLQ